jgi:hypothetical protein
MTTSRRAVLRVVSIINAKILINVRMNIKPLESSRSRWFIFVVNKHQRGRSANIRHRSNSRKFSTESISFMWNAYDDYTNVDIVRPWLMNPSISMSDTQRLWTLKWTATTAWGFEYLIRCLMYKKSPLCKQLKGMNNHEWQSAHWRRQF